MMPLFPHTDIEKKTIEGLDVFALMAQYGSPLLIFTERIILEKYRRLKEALEQYYPHAQIAYSVKTNYLPALMGILKEEGAFAEVVSGFEFWLARKLGFKPQEIIFNGPDKKTADIETALREGIMLNVDNQQELERIGQISKKLDRNTAIGLRVCTEIEPYAWNRFGFNIDDGEAYEAVKAMRNAFPRVEISGLHHHLDSNVNDPRLYAEAAERISDFALKIKGDFGIGIGYIDLGGGFAVPGSRWRNQPLWVAPQIDEYTAAIAGILNRKFPDQKPKLFVEPGRYLVDESGVFLTTAIAVKKIQVVQKTERHRFFKNIIAVAGAGEQNTQQTIQLVTVDSSITSIIKDLSFRQHFVEVIPRAIKTRNLNEVILTHIAGNSCIRRDFLAWDVTLSEVFANDCVLFFNAGAYTIVKSEQFIHPRPAVVLIGENGAARCIRKREPYENMISLDHYDGGG